MAELCRGVHVHADADIDQRVSTRDDQTALWQAKDMINLCQISIFL